MMQSSYYSGPEAGKPSYANGLSTQQRTEPVHVQLGEPGMSASTFNLVSF